MPTRAYAWTAALALLVVVSVINSHRQGNLVPAAPVPVTPAAATYAPDASQLGCPGAADLRPDGVVSLPVGTEAPQRAEARSVASWHCSDAVGRHPSLVQLLLGAPGDPYRPQRTILPTSAGMTVLRMQVHASELTLTVVAAATASPAHWQWLGTAWKLGFQLDTRNPGSMPTAEVPQRLAGPCRAPGVTVSASVPWTPWDLWSATGDYDQDSSTPKEGNSVQLRFVNHGPACVLTGYPSVIAAIGDLDQTAAPTLRGTFGGILSDPDPPVLMLDPREPATAVLEWARQACATTSTLSVALPGEQRRTAVSWPVGTCGLQVHPVTLQLFEPTG